MIMRARLSYGFLAAGFVLSLAAAGCGDDDTTPMGGSGGTSAGGKSGGGAGKSGSSGGGAGTAGSAGGGVVSVAQCVTDTTKMTMMSQPPACVTCICTADAKAVSACNSAKGNACWGLVGCYNAMCPGLDSTKPDGMNCAITKCAMYIADGAGTSAPVASLLTGTCKASCPAPSPGDAGAADAGN
jgi:hypothetical protein